MSFAARMLASVSGFVAKTVTGLGVNNTSPVVGVRAAGITLNNDGTSSGSLIGGWYTPTTAGVGTLVWAKLFTSGSSGTTVSGSITTSGWTQLTSGGGITFTSASPTSEGTGNYEIRLASDSAGATVIGSISGTWDVGYTP